jgi:RNA polymerase sigma factor (sigma-70 family)
MRQSQLRAVLGCLHRVANPVSDHLGDDQLLDRWRDQRDPAAFEVLVWRHGALVWNLCRRILHSEQDVEDAFQATFLTFLRKADTIGKGQFLGSWLYKVAYRIALAARAASARNVVQGLDGDVAQPEATGEDDLGPVLDEEVHRLPEKYRQPFVLCYLEGKTTDEAARDLGCPRGTVGTRLAWARQRLRSRLARRGVALSAGALATLLAGKASAASVPASLVLNTVQAATLGTAGNAVTAGVISARAAALSQGVLQAMFATKLKTVALVLFAIAMLGGGAGLLGHQAISDGTEPAQITEVRQPVAPVEEPVPANQDDTGRAEEDSAAVPEEDKPAPAQDKGEKKFDYPQVSGKVVRVDRDGKGLGLEVLFKLEGTQKVDIKLGDKTHLTFSHVGPSEAKPTEGYHADVWLDKELKDVASRVHLRGQRSIVDTGNEKLSPPHLSFPVVAVDGGGKGITLEKSGKRESEKVAIKFTEKTRVSFANVTRNGAKPTVGHVARVWLDDTARDTAKAVKFIGNAEGKPVEGKGQLADHSGRIVGLSGGKVLTVEVPAAEKGQLTRMDIKLTDATKESYHGVAADGAKPTEGYQVQVWLAEGSKDTAARVRFTRNHPRKYVVGKIVNVSADGSRFTVESLPGGKGGESAGREIKTTAKTTLVFSNVFTGGARINKGYHVHGWLVPGSDDTADELMLSRSEKGE